MSRYLFFSALMFGWAMLWTSCSKVVDVHCTPTQSYAINIFVGFDSADIQTLTFVKYSNNGLFNNPIDTAVQRLVYNHFSNTDTFPATIYHDTIYTSVLGGQSDWIVKAAPIGKEWRISDITYGDLVHVERSSSDHVRDKFSCPLASYEVDGRPVAGTSAFYFLR